MPQGLFQQKQQGNRVTMEKSEVKQNTKKSLGLAMQQMQICFFFRTQQSKTGDARCELVQDTYMKLYEYVQSTKELFLDLEKSFWIYISRLTLL